MSVDPGHIHSCTTTKLAAPTVLVLSVLSSLRVTPASIHFQFLKQDLHLDLHEPCDLKDPSTIPSSRYHLLD
jgi:hypothetical protein